MNRNIFLGANIIAVIIILLVSFSNVVGYSVVNSHPLNESPLFCVRKQNVLHETDGLKIVSEYLGKGKNIPVMIRKGNDAFEKIQDVIWRIKLMDDDTFKKFVDTVVYKLSQQEKNDGVKADKIIYELYQLQLTSKSFEREDISSGSDRTWRSTPTLCWFPGCLLLAGTAFTLLFIILYSWSVLFPTTFPTCGSDCVIPNLQSYFWDHLME